MSDAPADIEFFWDPVCPFAWITSRWIEKVRAQTDYTVDYRFISLRLINKHKDYATEFPKGYEHGHTAGLRMLRVAAAVRDELGREPMSGLYTAFGESYFDIPQERAREAPVPLQRLLREQLAAAPVVLRPPSHPPQGPRISH